VKEALPAALRDLQQIGAKRVHHISRKPGPDVTLPEETHLPPLLAGLRARQDTSRTAQVARALNESANARSGEGAFNPAAAAALSGWKEP
jgi:hypothetical protein